MRQVTSSLLASGVRRSDQQAVWSVVAEKSSRLGAASETAAMSAMYDNVDHSLDDFVAAFPPVDRQVGAVFVVDGRLAGLELFDASSIWRKLSPKLVRSYALDAIDFQRALALPSPQLWEGLWSKPSGRATARSSQRSARVKMSA
jgi:ARG and Rhodanese-Phosphatase-superfamily-associated Protein domain